MKLFPDTRDAYILDSAKIFKFNFLLVVLICVLTVPGNTQVAPIGINTAEIDSILVRYHLEGVKIFVQKLGVFSIKENMVALENNELDDRLLVTLQKTLTLNESGFGAKFEYSLTDHWVLIGESNRRTWGLQSAINVMYRVQY